MRNFIVANRIGVIIVHLAHGQTVLHQKPREFRVLVEHFRVRIFGGSLRERVAVFKIDDVAEGRGRNVVQKRDERLLFVASEIPNDERAIHAMLESRIKKFVFEKRGPISAAQKSDSFEANKNFQRKVFFKKIGKFRAQNFPIFFCIEFQNNLERAIVFPVEAEAEAIVPVIIGQVSCFVFKHRAD